VKAEIIGLFGLLGLWAIDNVSLAFTFCIGLITCVGMIYEKFFTKNDCNRCKYFIAFDVIEKKSEDDKGIKK